MIRSQLISEVIGFSILCRVQDHHLAYRNFNIAIDVIKYSVVISRFKVDSSVLPVSFNSWQSNQTLRGIVVIEVTCDDDWDRRVSPFDFINTSFKFLIDSLNIYFLPPVHIDQDQSINHSVLSFWKYYHGINLVFKTPELESVKVKVIFDEK